MAETKPHDPPVSVVVEPGKWYWGTMCLNCERPMAIKSAEITSAAHYPEQTSVFSVRCIHCSHDDHLSGHTIRSFRGA
jgi:hypothetical protein